MNQSCHKDSSKRNPMPAAVGIIFAVLGGYYLWMQHRAHVFQYLPLLVFLLCPLMHLFGGHGGQDHAGDEKKPSNE